MRPPDGPTLHDHEVLDEAADRRDGLLPPALPRDADEHDGDAGDGDDGEADVQRLQKVLVRGHARPG